MIIRKAVPDNASHMLELWKRLGEWLRERGIDMWRPERFSLDEIQAFFKDGADLYLAEMDGS
ncbi:MAG TPA: GNAT family N-acetyltransferase, partial [Paenibacillaceae bacterium]